MTKILMVCLGNICRSPLAEGILKSKLTLQNYFIDSAGTAGYHVGEKPDTRSIAVARKYGIDISDQRSRKFSVIDFDEFDYIYAMDSSNYQNIIALARNNSDIAKVKMILEEIPTFNRIDVPDPYYGGNDGFENVFQMLDKVCNSIAEKLA
jgi:protein-tyrosine phosphatase